jgi:Ig/ITIM domain-containing immunoreceptor
MLHIHPNTIIFSVWEVPLINLSLSDPPQVTILGYDNNWYVGRTNVALTCQATANPVPTTIAWKT